MALIPYPETEQLAPDLRELIERFSREHGRPTLARWILAWFPPALRALNAMYHPFLSEGKLDRRIKELMFAACCDVRACFY